MIRITAVLLCLALAACSTTSTVHQPLPQQQGSAVRAYAYSFENNGGDDLEGIATLDRLIRGRLVEAGLVAAAGASSQGSVKVNLTHYYVRSNAARFWVGIMAGRDKIVSQVTVLDDGGKQIGNFEVETTNISAWGRTQGLMEKHADEIVARLKG
jgi:hypothetical protein